MDLDGQKSDDRGTVFLILLLFHYAPIMKKNLMQSTEPLRARLWIIHVMGLESSENSIVSYRKFRPKNRNENS